MIVDLGSKFKMVSKLMKQAAYLDPAEVYQYNPHDPTHHLESGMSFHLDKDSVDQVADILNQILTTLPQYTLLFCVRPNLGDYDARYFRENAIPVFEEGSRIIPVVFEGTEKEFHEAINIPFLQRHQLKVMMNDVHYYIKDVSLEGTFYVSGLWFENTPGTYHLPCCEGSYQVYSDSQNRSQITMLTNGSGFPYNHQNI